MSTGVDGPMKGLFSRDGGWLQRLLFFGLLSLVLMSADHRGSYLEGVRGALMTVTYPLQRAAAFPPALFGSLQRQFRSLSAVRAENSALRAEVQALRLNLQRFEATLRENQRLRALLDSPSKSNERVQGAELIGLESTAAQRLVTIDRGSRNGVFRGQPVLDASGVLGQVLHVSPYSATVMLITDSRHALPVRVDRTGLLAVARGQHGSDRVMLNFVPNNADLELGDIVVTSGLGGRFPEGYSVGRIVALDTHPGAPFARVGVEPEARLSNAREVLLVWPETTVSEAATDAADSGSMPEAPAPASASGADLPTETRVTDPATVADPASSGSVPLMGSAPGAAPQSATGSAPGAIPPPAAGAAPAGASPEPTP